MALALGVASATLFLLNHFAVFPSEYAQGVALGFGLAGMFLWFAGYAVGRRKD